MNDFIPATAGAIVPNDQELSLEVKANMRLAEVMQDPFVMQLIQTSAQLKQYQQFRTIETQEQYDQAIEAFDVAKQVLKMVESKRHDVVDFPTMVTKLVNGFFKTIRDGLEQSKAHLGGLIQKKKSADEAATAAEAEKAKQERQEAGEQQQGEITEDGKVTFGDEPTPPPSNVVKSERGAKAHTRQYETLNVTDLQAFLKCISGKSKRYAWLQAAMAEVVEVKVGALKKVMADNGKRAVPGVEIEKVEKVV